jgi:hypothetical protein
MTDWTRCECAGDNLSGRAILAACGAGTRSDEALEAVAAPRARGYPGACMTYAEFAYRERRWDVLRAL